MQVQFLPEISWFHLGAILDAEMLQAGVGG
jgi:hypothetical protein